MANLPWPAFIKYLQSILGVHAVTSPFVWQHYLQHSEETSSMVIAFIFLEMQRKNWTFEEPSHVK
jgi:hypothetical protein